MFFFGFFGFNFYENIFRFNLYKIIFTCSCSPGLAQRNSYGWRNGWADLCRVMGRAEHACSHFLLSSSNLFSVVERLFPKLCRRQFLLRTMSSTKIFRAKERAWGALSVKNNFRTSSFKYFSILSLIEFTRNNMLLQCELFLNTRQHQYIYKSILALPQYPSLRFPKENCVSANWKILRG